MTSLPRAGTPEAAGNGALDLLGEPPILSLDDNRPAARAIKRAFGDVRDALLREGYWNFATTRVTPAAEPDAVTAGPFGKRYLLPDDCLFVREVVGLTSDDWAIEAAPSGVEAVALLTDAAGPEVVYTRRVDSVRNWDALFLATFQWRLAARIGPAIARDKAKIDTARAMAERALPTAARFDAKEKAQSEVTRSTSWVACR